MYISESIVDGMKSSLKDCGLWICTGTHGNIALNDKIKSLLYNSTSVGISKTQTNLDACS